MGAPLVVPFNHRPVSHQRGSGTYTVPANKYARVTIQFNNTFTGSISGYKGQFDSITVHGSDHGTYELWLKAGDTLSLSSANGGASSTSPSSDGEYIFTLNAHAQTVVTINGSVWSHHLARAFGSGRYSTYTSFITSVTTASLTPSNNYSWFAEEFNEIT